MKTEERTEFNLSEELAEIYKSLGQNLTDLPCVPIKQYYKERKERIIRLIKWHDETPYYSGVARNLEKLLEYIQDELGIN